MSEHYPPTLLRMGLYAERSYAKVDMRYPLGPAQLKELEGVEIEAPWVVMASEPMGTRKPRDQPRVVEFLDEVMQGPFPYMYSTLTDSQETYEVQAMAIALPLEEGIELAGRYGRDFLFWFDGEAFWYMPVPESAGPRVRLPAELPEWGPRLLQEQRLEGVRDGDGTDGEEVGPPKLRLIT